MSPRRSPGRSASERRTVVIRSRILLCGWVFAGAVILTRAGQIQIVQNDLWSEAAEAQHQKTSVISAPRGTILDRDETPLAVSQERYEIGIAPHEIVDPEAAVAGLVEAGISEGTARRYTESTRTWVVVPGRHSPSVQSALRGIRGIHLKRELPRLYPHELLVEPLLGLVRQDTARGGIERTFDELLQGEPGREVFARDNQGLRIPGESVVMEAPRQGGSVVLTLDIELQEIANEALQDALEETGASGGDVIVADPRTGEILAMTSIRDGVRAPLSTINAPYEPGSVMKPFTVAGLLDRDRIELSDMVETGNGVWTVNRRVLRDTHDDPDTDFISVREALRESSNVGIARAAERFEPGEQYQVMRDFGFGTLTGIEIPGEAAGTLRRPEDWSAQSRHSLAIGYEASVTPLQMVMAYSALANGGKLMEPQIVKELRDPSGRVLETFEPTLVRQVVSPRVAREISEVLVDVVEDGTGGEARLSTFTVAGKTGTSKVAARGGYEAGRYYATFAGFFPAEDPRLVVFVKIDEPKGNYYGGAAAAPVTRRTMEAVLSARSSPLDRTTLIQRVSEPRTRTARTSETLSDSPFRFASDEGAHRDPAPDPVDPTPGRTETSSEVRVPDISRLDARTAVRRLHAAGLRVRWNGEGSILGTTPRAGTVLGRGETVTLRFAGRR